MMTMFDVKGLQQKGCRLNPQHPLCLEGPRQHAVVKEGLYGAPASSSQAKPNKQQKELSQSSPSI
ncbi:hypothetical protein DUNSADRAFT_13997 [Dunaliella salina]|uniref:Encoded protein n=1 Tax=Dunaliella salina TaxID=3046 RepID=A0ABQ7G874_DUNSA|nr:hypothetical protein DUNSADRAFT_13997 [Dunaliella salina]|eukprot:KAF5830807.1 hypothetical protein DUNSADRAFT_13997 [Dunaliella salina]